MHESGAAAASLAPLLLPLLLLEVDDPLELPLELLPALASWAPEEPELPPLLLDPPAEPDDEDEDEDEDEELDEDDDAADEDEDPLPPLDEDDPPWPLSEPPSSPLEKAGMPPFCPLHPDATAAAASMAAAKYLKVETVVIAHPPCALDSDAPSATMGNRWLVRQSKCAF